LHNSSGLLPRDMYIFITFTDEKLALSVRLLRLGSGSSLLETLKRRLSVKSFYLPFVPLKVMLILGNKHEALTATFSATRKF
jgi:hypothetical protein